MVDLGDLTGGGSAEAELDAPEVELTHRQVMIIISGLMLGLLLAALDQTIVATALPTIAGDLGGLNHLSWIVTAYLLASTVSTPLYGKLGDLYGRKRLFQIAIVVFLIGSVLCGIAQDMVQLVAFRAVQGIGGGGLLVLTQAIIADVVSPRERGRYQGYFGALFGATSVAGPLLGGFLTDNLSWRWVFYVNLPLGLLALVVTSSVLPVGTRRPDVHLDYLGSAVLVAGVSCIVLFVTWGGSDYAWTSRVIVALMVASVASVAILYVVERRAVEPVVPLHLFAMRAVSISSSVVFILAMAMFATISFLPLFLQVVNGASATNSGLLLLPLLLAMLGSSVVAGLLITKTGRYKLFPVAGTACAAVALSFMSTMSPSTPPSIVSAYMVLFGIGAGATMPTMILAAQNAVATGDLGAATSTVGFFRAMGGSIGIAMAGAVFNNRLNARLDGISVDVREGSGFTPQALRELPPDQAQEAVSAFSDAVTTIFLAATPLVAVAFALTWLLRETPLRGQRSDLKDGARIKR